MLLFRYFGSHTFETLDKARLKTSRVRDLNDPFEFLYSPKRTLTAAEADSLIQNRLTDLSSTLRSAFPADSPDQLRQRLTHPNVVKAVVAQNSEIADQGLMKQRLDSADATLRLVCFSSAQASPQDEILLWSHYANKHRGHRIGFEMPNAPMNGYRIDPVEYSPRRVEVDYTGDSSDPKLLAALHASIGTKCRVWAYESEFRLAIDSKLCVPDEEFAQMDHFPFDPRRIVRVDCGLQSDPAEDAKIVALVKERYPRASVYKAQFHPTDYSIEYALIHAGSSGLPA